MKINYKVDEDGWRHVSFELFPENKYEIDLVESLIDKSRTYSLEVKEKKI